MTGMDSVARMKIDAIIVRAVASQFRARGPVEKGPAWDGFVAAIGRRFPYRVEIVPGA